MFFWMVYVYNFLTEWNILVCINASLKDDDDIQRHYTVQQTNSEALLISALCSKKLYFVPIACQCVLSNCGANMRRPAWSAYVLHITMPIELCITKPEMLVFAHTRLAIVSGPLITCWETTCIDFLYDAHLHPTFLFDRFKCLMLFTNLHVSSIIQRSCMVETECSSCSWVVSVFASHQYCFCVVKLCGHCVHTKHKKN